MEFVIKRSTHMNVYENFDFHKALTNLHRNCYLNLTDEIPYPEKANNFLEDLNPATGKTTDFKNSLDVNFLAIVFHKFVKGCTNRYFFSSLSGYTSPYVLQTKTQRRECLRVTT